MGKPGKLLCKHTGRERERERERVSESDSVLKFLIHARILLFKQRARNVR